MLILPAIDIFGGKCVRLTHGDFSTRKVYGPTPLEMAENFARDGAQWLHVVDLEGAKEGRLVNWEAIRSIAALQGVSMEAGGGVRSRADAEKLLEIGVDRVIVGSFALRYPAKFAEWTKACGPENFRVAIDLKDGRIALEGWQDLDDRPLADVIPPLVDLGIREFLSTDIGRDGTLAGPNVRLYSRLAEDFPNLRWFASGGVRSAADALDLKKTGVAGVIVGKALYEGSLALKELLSC